MRTLIEVNCNDQDLKVVNGPLIASGGIHENFVAFTFCEKWAPFTKTAVFYQNPKKPYYAMLDSNNTCEIPHEVTDNPGYMYIGVFGVTGDITRTSKMIRYQVKQGAIIGESEPSDPTPEVWEQLIALYTEVIGKVDASNKAQENFIYEANKVIIGCNEAANECYSAIASLNFHATDLDGGDPSTEEVTEDANDINGGSPY